MYIGLSELALAILFFLAVAAGIYLILVLRQALAALRRIKGIIDAQDTAIQQTLAQLPTLLASLSALSLSLKQSADMASSTLGAWQDELAGTVEDFRDGLETVTLYSKAIGEVVRTVFNK